MNDKHKIAKALDGAEVRGSEKPFLSTMKRSCPIDEAGLISDFLSKNEAFKDLTRLSLNLYRTSQPDSPLHEPAYNCELLKLLDRCGALEAKIQQAAKYAMQGEPVTLDFPLGFSSSIIPLRSSDGRTLDYHIRLDGYFLEQVPSQLAVHELQALKKAGLPLDNEGIFQQYRRAQCLKWKTLERMVQEINRIAAELVRDTEKAAPPPCNHPAVRKGLDYIERHLDEEICLKTVARHAGMSHFHFSRVFHQETGASFTRYVSQLRCQKALEMLSGGELRISEIAFSCGFQSLSQFNRSFISFFGKNPTTFCNEFAAERTGEALEQDTASDSQ